MKLKAVLDTNIMVSGIFWTGPPFEVLKAWQQGSFTLVLSTSILEEYRRVLAEMVKKHPSKALGPILEIIESHSVLVEPVSFDAKVCDDPDDDKFLEAAIAAGAHYLVSGDSALLRVKEYGGINIIKPAQFLKILSH